MNNQEFFDASVAHLRKQGRRAASGDSCMYRMTDADGTVLSCAVGGVMPDDIAEDVAAHGLNGAAAHRLMDKHSPSHEFFRGVDVRLMGVMQHVHDAHQADGWEKEFAAVASEFALQLAPAA